MPEFHCSVEPLVNIMNDTRIGIGSEEEGVFIQCNITVLARRDVLKGDAVSAMLERLYKLIEAEANSKLNED
jgi:hypothetical protein